MTRVRSARRGEVRQERRVLRLHRLPVAPVHARVVEEVAVDPPGLVEDLRPLGARVDAHLDGVELQLPVAVLAVGLALALLPGRSDAPAFLHARQELLAVEGDLVVVDLGGDRLGLAALRVPLLESRLPVGVAEEPDLAGVRRGERGDLGGRDREVDDAEREAVAVDDDRVDLLRARPSSRPCRPCRLRPSPAGVALRVVLLLRPSRRPSRPGPSPRRSPSRGATASPPSASRRRSRG